MSDWLIVSIGQGTSPYPAQVLNANRRNPPAKRIGKDALLDETALPQTEDPQAPKVDSALRLSRTIRSVAEHPRLCAAGRGPRAAQVTLESGRGCAGSAQQKKAGSAVALPA